MTVVPASLQPSVRSILRFRATRGGTALAYEYLSDTGSDVQSLTYGDLDRKARGIAAWLADLDVAGKPIVLIYPPGLDFLAGFFGTLYANAIPVPLNPPGRGEAGSRVQGVIASTAASLVLTTSSLASRVARLTSSSPASATVHLATTDELAITDGPPPFAEDREEPGRIAFLQYTSGSTAQPRGVVIRNRNLNHNLQLMADALGLSRSSRGVSWLPQYHDMGLIGGILLPLFVGFPVTLMSPGAFIRAPLRWLRQISDTGATISAAPDFGYAHCVRMIPEDEVAELDLSHWRSAVSGAEVVRADTIENFVRVFSRAGFQRRAFFPCYGLAEATLMVSGGPAGEGPTTERFAGPSFEAGPAIPGSVEGPEGRALVASGRVPASVHVAIVEAATGCRLADRQVGEIWVAGPSVSEGYWQDTASSAESFGARLASGEGGPFLRTGDLGFMRGDLLYVLGRSKDMLNVHGRNYFPLDIEISAEQATPVVRAGSSAAFSVAADGGERAVLVCEVDPSEGEALESVARTIFESVLRGHELALDEISLVRRGSVPRTTSGKVQRGLCRSRYLGRELRVVWQWARRAEAGSVLAEFSIDLPAVRALPLDRRAATLRSMLIESLRNHVSAGEADLGPEISFFSMGIDSVAAAALCGRLSKALSVDLTIAELFEHPTIAQLSGVLAEKLQPAQVAGDQADRLAGLAARLNTLVPAQAAALLAAAKARSIKDEVR